MKRLLLGVVLMAACHPVQDVSQVDSAVDQFHERLAAGDLDAIYLQAGPEYQRTIDLETNRRFLGRVRRKMGVPGHATRIGYGVTNEPRGTVATAQYQTAFTNGSADETFVWRMKDGKAILLGFTVNSSLMSTD